MPLHRSRRYWLLVAGVAFWLFLVVGAPLLHQSSPFWSDTLYAGFSRICHQQPERSLHLADEPLAVCSRCCGLYAGLWLGLLAIPYLRRFSTALIDRPRLLILFGIPLLIDLLSPNTVLSRFLTGGLAAFPVALFVWQAAEQFRPAPARRKL